MAMYFDKGTNTGARKRKDAVFFFFWGGGRIGSWPELFKFQNSFNCH